VLSPLQRYEKELAAGTLLDDPAQAEAIGQLDELHSRLCARLVSQRAL